MRPRAVVTALLLTLLPMSMTMASEPADGSGPLPSFVRLKDMTIPVDDLVVPLGYLGLRYHRGSVDSFDDSETPGHDGIALPTRKYLACETDQWSIGNQTFTTDIVELGLHRRDRSMIERGARGLDWALSLPIDDEGVFWLERDCDGTSAPSSGGTHHTTQWFEALGRAVYLLQASALADEYSDRIDGYVDQIEQMAELLTDPANFEFWQMKWLHDAAGNPFTHKAYMMAAGLAMAADLTDDADDAARWTELAREMARFGMAQQHPDGHNPERGGYDVSYQMYGTWLALIYQSLLADDDPLYGELEDRISSALAWMSARTDPDTGEVEIGDSSRTCNRMDDFSHYPAEVGVRVYLYWALTHPGDDEALDLALAMDRGRRAPGHLCET